MGFSQHVFITQHINDPETAQFDIMGMMVALCQSVTLTTVRNDLAHANFIDPRGGNFAITAAAGATSSSVWKASSLKQEWTVEVQGCGWSLKTRAETYKTCSF